MRDRGTTKSQACPHRCALQEAAASTKGHLRKGPSKFTGAGGGIVPDSWLYSSEKTCSLVDAVQSCMVPVSRLSPALKTARLSREDNAGSCPESELADCSHAITQSKLIEKSSEEEGLHSKQVC